MIESNATARMTMRMATSGRAAKRRVDWGECPSHIVVRQELFEAVDRHDADVWSISRAWCAAGARRLDGLKAAAESSPPV